MSGGEGNPYTCTQIDSRCQISDTIYGYYPTLPGNIIFLVVSVFCILGQTYLGIRYKTWSYLLVMWCGCFAEALGFTGRILLHFNPFSNTGFTMQVCCLIMGPAWLAVGIYLTLKHIVKAYGAQYSYLPPKYYTWLFIAFDVISLSLQAAGGGLASGAEGKPDQMTLGNNLAISGIVMQVVTLIIFGGLAAIYFVRRHRHQMAEFGQRTPTDPALQTKRFKGFLIALAIAFVTIFIRCTYRIPELSGGWSGPLMKDEGLFIALDNVMVLITMIALTVCHPGWCFPQMARPIISRKKKVSETIEEGKGYGTDSASEPDTSADAPPVGKE